MSIYISFPLRYDPVVILENVMTVVISARMSNSYYKTIRYYAQTIVLNFYI